MDNNYFFRQIRGRTIELRRTIVVSGVWSPVELARRGYGMSIVSELAVRPLLERGELRTIDITGLNSSKKLYAVCRDEKSYKQMEPVINTITDVIRRAFALEI